MKMYLSALALTMCIIVFVGCGRNVSTGMCPDAPGPVTGPIVFGSRSNLFSIQADGKNAIQITDIPPNFLAHEPSWSPNGSLLAFTLIRFNSDTGEEDSSIICGINRQTGKGDVLIQNPDKDGFLSQPSWISNSRLIFTYNDTHKDVLATYTIGNNINKQKIPDNIQQHYPFVNRKGNKILYVERVLYPKRTEFLVIADVNDIQTKETKVFRSDLLSIIAPHWSPDGKQILFMMRSTSLSDYKPLTTPTLLDQLMHVSVANAHGLPTDVWIVNQDGTGLRKLLTGLDDTRADWSPDSRSVIYTGGQTHGLFIYHLANEQIQQLSEYGDYGGLSWAPN